MGIVTLSICHLVHSSLPSCKLGVLLCSPLLSLWSCKTLLMLEKDEFSCHI